MYKQLEQLLQIRKLCLNELNKAQANCDQYSANMTMLAEKLQKNWQSTNNFLIEYDAFVTSITKIMDAARKFNLHVDLNNLKLREMQNVLSKINKSQSVSANTKKLKKKKTINKLFPAEEIDLNLEDGDDFVYPTLNLSEVYKINEIINSTVTYIKNLKDLSFYIIDNSSKYRLAVAELSKTLGLRQYTGKPATNEVFGYVLDNQIFRAVMGSKTYYDVEMDEEIVPCYILDTGEILPLKSDHIMYRLTDDQKSIPALALPCQLKINKNPFTTKEMMESKLKEYEKYDLRVLAIENNIIDVEIVENSNLLTTEINLETTTTVPSKADSNNTSRIQLTQEEIDVLFEEPLSTTNAMKAVMGYDPQDDKRICRFYNPSTGGCFKGVNCKLEHSFRQADGWTKDILPTASIIDSHPVTVFPPDSIINITPTFVGQLDRFFAQINDPSKNIAPLLWNDEDVPSRKILQKPPHMYELVLSRYVDGFWYRAKIMSHDDDYKMFKVFYVDYGNVQVVHWQNLASIEIGMDQMPFQAVLCRFESVKEKSSLSPEDRKKCIEILCEMILNKAIDVKVISHYEDLFISFVDQKNYRLPDVLVEMGYLEVNKNKIVL